MGMDSSPPGPRLGLTAASSLPLLHLTQIPAVAAARGRCPAGSKCGVWAGRTHLLCGLCSSQPRGTPRAPAGRTGAGSHRALWWHQQPTYSSQTMRGELVGVRGPTTWGGLARCLLQAAPRNVATPAPHSTSGTAEQHVGSSRGPGSEPRPTALWGGHMRHSWGGA